jgi:hypothetical protein
MLANNKGKNGLQGKTIKKLDFLIGLGGGGGGRVAKHLYWFHKSSAKKPVPDRRKPV